MLKTHSLRRQNQRTGVVLVVVIAMLALFAIVALSFVYYAESEATQAGLVNQAQSLAEADMDPNVLLAYFLSQFIYDTDNIYSSMRGHSLARTMYGYNPLDVNEIPYGGLGRMRFSVKNPLILNVPVGNDTRNNEVLINYVDYSKAGAANPSDAAMPFRNPEGLGVAIAKGITAGGIATITTSAPHTFAKGQTVTVAGLGVPGYNGTFTISAVGPGPNPPYTTFSYNVGIAQGASVGTGVATASVYTAGNVHWTYPDLNNMFLAAVNASGEVLIPSFNRPWLGLNPPAYPAADPNAGNLWAKYMTLRPHSSYHSAFTTPDWDGFGDVKNLEWGLGTRVPPPAGGAANGPPTYVGNDSIWMDLGFPVMTAANGKRFKPLFAPLVVDMDNKINLYAHGNIMNTGSPVVGSGAHFSSLGYGMWEVNLSKLLNQGPGGTEWLKLFQGSPIARYGANGQPDGGIASPLSLTSPIPAYYSKIDYGGLTGQQVFAGVTKYLYYPWDANDPSFASGVSKLHTYLDYAQLPTVPPAGWDNATGNDLQTALNRHASGYNPNSTLAGDDKVALVMSQIEALYRYQGTGSPSLTSDLFTNLPFNMQSPRIRWLSALRSGDMDRPGLFPFNWKDMTQAPPPGNPLGQNSDYKFAGAVFPTSSGATFPSSAASIAGEFDKNGWRSNVSAKTKSLGGQLRLVLSRPLASYGQVDATGKIANVTSADQDRQDMAKDIYTLLIQLTGARDPNIMPGSVAETNAARWLAQLAVNIVDFIDEDDVITGFNWTGTEYVFGTELPQLVLNEVYAQVDNDPNDTPPIATKYNVNFWVELHNPLSNTPLNVNIVTATSALVPPAPPPFPAKQTTLVTATTATNHGLAAGQKVTIVGSSVASYNGTFDVVNVPSKTVFQYQFVQVPQPPAAKALPAAVGGTLYGPYPSNVSKVYLKTQPTDGATPAQPIYQVAISDMTLGASTYFDASDPTYKNTIGDFSTPINSYYYTTFPPQWNVNSASAVGTLVTLDIGVNKLSVNQSVVVTGVGANYDGPQVITAVAGNQINYNASKAPAPAGAKGIVRLPGIVDDWVAGADFVDVANPLLPYGPDNTGKGFYVMGPKNWSGTPLFAGVIAARDPKIVTTAASAASYTGLSFSVPAVPATAPTKTYGVFLKRLANPYMSFQGNAALPFYNPYVTVDYVNTLNPLAVASPQGIYDNRVYDDKGIVAPAKPLPPVHASIGRRQPYMNSRWINQNPVPAPLGQPKHTFTRHNGRFGTLPLLNKGDLTLDTPFYWPVHFDRRLVSPMDLVNISTCRPWEFTQKFGTGRQVNIAGVNEAGSTATVTTALPHGFTPGNAVMISGVAQNGYNGVFLIQPPVTATTFTYTTMTNLPASGGGTATLLTDHRSGWELPDTLLYRLLESATQSSGPPTGSRITGKINLNTIWDPEILDALIDNPNIKVAAYITNASVIAPGPTVRVTTSAAHGFKVGDQVTVSGLAPSPAYDGTYIINGVPSPTQFTYIDIFAGGAPPASTGGYAVNQNSLFKLFMDARGPKVVGTGAPGATDDVAWTVGATPGDAVISPPIAPLFVGGVTTPIANMNKPFKSLNVGMYAASNATSQYPNGLGIQNTILRSGVFQQADNVTTNAAGVTYPGGFPFKKNEILSKIMNNVTTRSNVFACWLTVGFFEVVDETATPPKLGGEIGRAENRHVRHRMFAVIDRTNLIMPDPIEMAKPKYAAQLAANVIKGNARKVTFKTIIDPNPSTGMDFANAAWKLRSTDQLNVAFKIRPGMQLDFISEKVFVLSVDYTLNEITANFTQNHLAGSMVTPVLSNSGSIKTVGPITAPNPNTFYGNPGPQDDWFDPRQNAAVVPYFSIIQ